MKTTHHKETITVCGLDFNVAFTIIHGDLRPMDTEPDETEIEIEDFECANSDYLDTDEFFDKFEDEIYQALEWSL